MVWAVPLRHFISLMPARGRGAGGGGYHRIPHRDRYSDGISMPDRRALQDVWERNGHEWAALLPYALDRIRDGIMIHLHGVAASLNVIQKFDAPRRVFDPSAVLCTRINALTPEWRQRW